jgi:hypothetical protein
LCLCTVKDFRHWGFACSASFGRSSRGLPAPIGRPLGFSTLSAKAIVRANVFIAGLQKLSQRRLLDGEAMEPLGHGTMSFAQAFCFNCNAAPVPPRPAVTIVTKRVAVRYVFVTKGG